MSMVRLGTGVHGSAWVLSVMVLAAAVPARAEGWPQYNGPVHGRRSNERISISSGTAPRHWTIDTNAGFSSFVTGDGKAFTLVTRQVNDATLEICIAIDLSDGRELWWVPLGKAKYTGGGNAGASDNNGGDGPRSTPSYDEGKVIVLDSRLRLHCLDARSGDTVWSKDILKEYAGRLITWENAACPLIEGDMVFVAGGGEGQSLLAFEKHTGKLAWAVEDDRMTHATPVAATIHHVRQVIFFTQKGLVSVIPATGKVLWRQPYKYSTSTAASPVVFEDIVYCSAGYGVGAAAYRIRKTASGFESEEIWRKRNKLMNHWSTPLCKDGYLYGMFSFKKYGKGPIMCVDIRTGKTLWSKPGFGPGNCILVGEHLVALSDKGEVVLIEARPDAYREHFRDDILEGKCWSSPAYSNGCLYVRSTRQGASLSFPSRF